MNASISFEDEQGIFFDVEGDTDDYLVHIWKDNDEAFCNCPSFYFRKKECKHIAMCRSKLNDSDQD